jgi:ribosome assembly protein 4
MDDLSLVPDSIMPSSFGRERLESELLFFHFTIKLMNRFIANLRGHVAAVYRVAWSADSRMLVSASKDTTLKVSRSFFSLAITDKQLWDLKTFKIRIDLPGHTDEVYCVDFIADKVVSGGRDKTVKM